MPAAQDDRRASYAHMIRWNRENREEQRHESTGLPMGKSPRILGLSLDFSTIYEDVDWSMAPGR